jgi:hypothetical protein
MSQIKKVSRKLKCIKIDEAEETINSLSVLAQTELSHITHQSGSMDVAYQYQAESETDSDPREYWTGYRG